MKTSSSACTALAFFYISTFEDIREARKQHLSGCDFYGYSRAETDKAFQYAMKNQERLKDAIRNAHKLRST